MEWNIVTDSACDLMPKDDGEIGFSCVPFVIRVGERDYVDDEQLDTLDMLDMMDRTREASHTSCPSPGAWASKFERAKNNIAVTISGRLSGSHNSATAAKDIALKYDPKKKIAVLDSCSTGPEIVMCVNRVFELIRSGLGFDEVVAAAQAFLDRTRTVFVLSSFDTLIKNGRMSKILGFIAHTLGMRGIGVGSDDGEIVIKDKTRGADSALSILIEDMRQRGFFGGNVTISHCHNLSLAETLRQKIIDLWNTAQITILPTRGLDSYYAARGGLIVAY